MIRPQRLTKYMTAEPFRPFRIRMTSGESLRITDPEMLAISRFFARIDFWWSDDPAEEMMGVRKVPLLSIESVEPIAGSLAPEPK